MQYWDDRQHEAGGESAYARNEYRRGKAAYFAGKDRDDDASEDWLAGWDECERNDRGQ